MGCGTTCPQASRNVATVVVVVAVAVVVVGVVVVVGEGVAWLAVAGKKVTERE